MTHTTPSESPTRPCSHHGCPRFAKPEHGWCAAHLVAFNRYGYSGHRRLTERDLRPHRRVVEYVIRAYAGTPLVREYVAEVDRLLHYRATTEVRLDAALERAMLTARDRGATARDVLESLCVPYVMEGSTFGRFASAEHVDRVAAWAVLKYGNVHPRNSSGGIAAFLGSLIRERFARFAYTVLGIYQRDLAIQQARHAALADPTKWPEAKHRRTSVRFPRPHGEPHAAR